MPMPIADNQTEIGDQLFWFESTNGADTRCLVMAHGGVGHPLPTFVVPNLRTVRFYTVSGEAFVPAIGGIRAVVQRRPDNAGAQIAGRPEELLTYGPGSTCVNYKLSKILGWHETGVEREELDTTYQDVANYMGQIRRMFLPEVAGWTPNIVTVRYRGFHKGGKTITLQHLVDQVLRAKPRVTSFYVAACRVEFVGKKRVTR